ncbi:scopoletin glucosyltransferase-like [Mangifera indica]|uniref:scopoletin glucosyltransferase-like n=1 Tax=Mangifera indica TaxID=29780 RepID=UPI001CFB64B9|nr:scopoletin glucosyltransferase-like [Mangifera indica]
MGSEIPRLRMFFFPFLAYGHMIPAVDMAKLFGSRGVKTTIITTPANALLISKSIQMNKHLGIEIDVKIIKFPSGEAGLPEGCENLDAISNIVEMAAKFLKATTLLREPLEELLGECKPDCLVADMFFPWATAAAAKFGILSLVFHGTSFFSLCTSACLVQYQPHKKVSSDSEPFVVPNLPGDIKLTRKQVPDFLQEDGETGFTMLWKDIQQADITSFGTLVNSFYELEPAYADHYRKVLGRRSWHVGPLSLCNRNVEDKALRGKQASIDEHECLKWLNSKKPNSVIYVCFGSLANFSSAQLMELALGLEASGQQFIWVVRKNKNAEEEKEDWLPEGFEKRMEGRGLITRGWTPEVLILDHEALGGFVTHCGWNSTLEGVTAGVPMVTWPVFAEQFYNEKLVTEVLKIGTAVGVQQWSRVGGDFVKREAVEKVVKEVPVGDKAEEMRIRAKALGQMAKRAVEKGGSSYTDLNAFIEELSSQRRN